MTETILHRLHNNGRIRPNAPAYYEKTGDAWVPTSWQQYLAQVRQAARALIALGFQPGQTVSILGFNRPEWVIMDLAGMLAGGAAVGIYTTNAPEECKYIVEHSESPVVLVENEDQWQKMKEVRDDIATLQHIVLMKGTQIDDEMTLDWDAFMAKGDEVPEEAVDERLDGLKMDDLATLIYTSGTTGPPKGVMLSHNNLAWTSESAIGMFDLTSNDRVISYLPLSHIAEQMFTIHASVTVGYQVYFAQYHPQDHLNDNFREVQPTIIFGVPRIWERFAQGVAMKLGESEGVKAKIAAWAQNVGAKAAAVRNRGEEVGGFLGWQHNLAEKLVFSTVKAGLGLSEAKLCISAAAPISPDVLTFFNKFNVPLFELYGQSEDCGPTSTNMHGANKIGTVGRKWPGTEVKLADDGEILVKGNHVFMGYYKNESATASDLIDGWLQSGDLGQYDDDGFLSIVGRKKEIIITSGGKNIAPKNIEAALKNIELVAQAVVIGEKRRFLTALITLEPEAAAHFASQHGLEGQTLHSHSTLTEYMQKQIDEHVNSLFARVEQVRGFKILPRDFTIEDGELTPTLKIKRRIVNENFAGEIEAMYEK